jgi:hypothetical protein
MIIGAFASKYPATMPSIIPFVCHSCGVLEAWL